MNNFDLELIKRYLPKENHEEALAKLKTGYPVQYLIGNVEFYNTVISVNENVLIPRFETEYLVDDLLKIIKDNNFVNPRILDIGTGSGCIAISLKKHLDSNVEAIDISKNAIDIAKQNAISNGVNVNFINVGIEEYVSNNRFDVLVSNPPYVPFTESVDAKTKYEPQNAIFAKDDGLYYYKLIVEKSKDLLNKRNIMAFEIGHNQASKVMAIIKEQYPTANIVSKSDLNGFDRYIYVIND